MYYCSPSPQVSVRVTTHQLVDEPGSGEDEGDVEYHVDHGGPVDVRAGDVVELLHDVGDDGVLDPLEGVRHGVEDEEGEGDPASLVHPAFCEVMLCDHLTI